MLASVSHPSKVSGVSDFVFLKSIQPPVSGTSITQPSMLLKTPKSGLKTSCVLS